MEKNRAFRKLRNRRGMSLLFAILIFLMCSLAGAAAITAAAANAGRYSHLRADQQKYYIASSAAELVRDTLAGDTVKFIVWARLEKEDTWTLFNSGTAEDPSYEWIGPTTSYSFSMTSAGDDPYTGALEGWLEDDLLKLFRARDIPSSWADHVTIGDTIYNTKWDSLTVTVDPVTAGKMKGNGVTDDECTVHWTLSLDGNYNLTAQLWITGEAGQEYLMELTVPAQSNTTTSTNTSESNSGITRVLTTTTTVTTTVEWPRDRAELTQVKWTTATPGP